MESYDAIKHPYCYGIAFSAQSEVCVYRCQYGLQGTCMCPSVRFQRPIHTPIRKPVSLREIFNDSSFQPFGQHFPGGEEGGSTLI